MPSVRAGHGDAASGERGMHGRLSVYEFCIGVSPLPSFSPCHTTASQTNQAPAACIDSHALTHAHPDHQVREINRISSFIVPLLILEL